MLGETVLFSIAWDLLLGSKAPGAVPPSVQIVLELLPSPASGGF